MGGPSSLTSSLMGGPSSLTSSLMGGLSSLTSNLIGSLRSLRPILPILWRNIVLSGYLYAAIYKIHNS